MTQTLPSKTSFLFLNSLSLAALSVASCDGSENPPKANLPIESAPLTQAFIPEADANKSSSNSWRAATQLFLNQQGEVRAIERKVDLDSEGVPKGRVELSVLGGEQQAKIGTSTDFSSVEFSADGTARAYSIQPEITDAGWFYLRTAKFEFNTEDTSSVKISERQRRQLPPDIYDDQQSRLLSAYEALETRQSYKMVFDLAASKPSAYGSTKLSFNVASQRDYLWLDLRFQSFALQPNTGEILTSRFNDMELDRGAQVINCPSNTGRMIFITKGTQKQLRPLSVVLKGFDGFDGNAGEEYAIIFEGLPQGGLNLISSFGIPYSETSFQSCLSDQDKIYVAGSKRGTSLILGEYSEMTRRARFILEQDMGSSFHYPQMKARPSTGDIMLLGRSGVFQASSGSISHGYGSVLLINPKEIPAKIYHRIRLDGKRSTEVRDVLETESNVFYLAGSTNGAATHDWNNSMQSFIQKIEITNRKDEP